MTTISLYRSGTTPADSTSTIEYQAGTNTVGQQFSVDIYINNPLPVQIWGWNLGVTWNPAAIELTKISEGTYLNQTSVYDTTFEPGYINTVAGDTPQGISDVIVSTAAGQTGLYTTDTPSGILATLTFTVMNYLSSPIDLVQGATSL